MKPAPMLGRVAVTLAAALVTLPLQPPAPAVTVGAPSPPRSVRAVVKDTAVKVTWVKPRVRGAGRIDRYKIVRWVGAGPRVAVKVPASRRSLELTGLASEMTYSFTVQAHNARGWSTPSKTARVWLPPSLPLPGFGTITATCGTLEARLPEPTASMIEARLDFGTTPYTPEHKALLTPGGQRLLDSPDTGGSARLSEVFGFEVLNRCERATLLKTADEIGYSNPAGQRTDFLVQVGVPKAGVGVVRARGYPLDVPYTTEQATHLLQDALSDIDQSTANVLPEDAWAKQVLVVVTPNDQSAGAVSAAWSALAATVRGDTVVLRIITDGDDSWLY